MGLPPPLPRSSRFPSLVNPLLPSLSFQHPALARQHQVPNHNRPSRTHYDRRQHARARYTLLPLRTTPPVRKQRRTPDHTHDVERSCPHDGEPDDGSHVARADDIEGNVGRGIGLFLGEITAHFWRFWGLFAGRLVV